MRMSKNFNHGRMILLWSIAVMVFFLGIGVWRSEKNCYASKNNETSDKANSCLSNSAEEVDINKWQTYHNDQYGFELKYPPGFEKKELLSDDYLLSLRKEETDILIIDVRLQPKHLVNDNYREENNGEKIEIGGRQGYQYFFQEGIGYTGVILIPLERKALQITCEVVGDSGCIDKADFVKRNIKKIASTIKFVE
jgi:hypothetical protein